MNCLEFRRRVATEPGGRDDEMLAHEASCEPCAAHAQRAARFASMLTRAVRVPVPAGLVARALIDHEPAPPPRRRWHLALAASVLLAFAAGGIGWWTVGRTDALADDIIELVNTAPFALEADGPVATEDVLEALRPTGIGLERPIGELTYAAPCVVRGNLAGHIVLRGRSAKVTVLIMPLERVARRAEFESFHFSGILVPAERGAVAIIGAPGERLDAIERDILDAIRWPA